MSKLSGLYAITDPKLMQNDFIAKATQAIHAGINILQYRNKIAPIAQQEQEAFELSKLCKNNNVLFLINDNIDLAIKVNADGVHLGQSDTNLQQARKLLGGEKIIGMTCHNKIELAENAINDGADYVAFGRFFNSETKPSASAADISLLAEARKKFNAPIAAIGGITPEYAPSLLNEGVDMLAVIHGIFGQEDIPKATQQFIEIFDSPKRID